ncbi:MAG: S8 family serine peptidase [bacterium]
MFTKKGIHNWMGIGFIILAAILLICSPLIQADCSQDFYLHNLQGTLWPSFLLPLDPVTGIPMTLVDSLDNNTLLSFGTGSFWEPLNWNSTFIRFKTTGTFGSELLFFDNYYGLNTFSSSSLIDSIKNFTAPANSLSDFSKQSITQPVSSSPMDLTLNMASLPLGWNSTDNFENENAAIKGLEVSENNMGFAVDGTPLLPESILVSSVTKDNISAIQAVAGEETQFKKVSIIVTFDESLDESALESVSNGKIVHRYDKVFKGASLILPEDNVDAVSSLKGITGVYLDEIQRLYTDISPDFINAPVLWDQLGGQENAGEGVVVGLLDSGIWPEHPSFSDPDPSGKPYPDPPAPPDGCYECAFGNTSWNPNDAPFTCNNKLIGAYSFIDTYNALYPYIGLLPVEFNSARDGEGHGTHTSSTAAGNGGVEASIFGRSLGTISGIAPRAHVIMYKVCGPGDGGGGGACFDSDMLMAIEAAINDGVDVINFSIGGPPFDPYEDIVEFAFLSAYENGVFVAAAVGNSGPIPDTVDNRAPWVTSVGASTTNRHFMSTVTLEADNGDSLNMTGSTVTDGIDTPTDVVLAADYGDEMCLNPFPSGTFSGQIVCCARGGNARVAKSYNVAEGGAGGMLLYNVVPQGLNTDNHFVPSVHLENDAGAALLDFMDTHTGVKGTFTTGTAATVKGDVMAPFSSRGGSGQTLGISKPDITAPGVQILAGWTPMPGIVVGGLPGQLFASMQGTSMSSPHIAGCGALLKALHPEWTPGQIKSALMTTALTAGVFKEDGFTPADPFDYGSGRVDLSRAGNPGVTISATAQDFWDLRNDLFNANYPSLYLPGMPGMITVERTLHSELAIPSAWMTSVDSPPDMTVIVPTVIYVINRRDTTFNITVDARTVPIGEVRHATLYLRNLADQDQVLRFPITIVRGQPPVSLAISCDPEVLARGETTECTITFTNNSFDEAIVSLVDDLPRELMLVKGSLVGTGEKSLKTINYDGTLYPLSPPTVIVIDGTGTTPPYLPLSLFGITPISGVTDETIISFGTYPFVYGGEIYNTIGMVSNGYAVVGGGDSSDINYINQSLPDPARPNNVLAPFWTDLNPADGGELRAGYLTDGIDLWLILDWENVTNWGDNEPNSFQIWIGVNGVEDISFTYGEVLSDGDGGFLTVGAENKYGNSGQNWYFNGDGTLVSDEIQLRVESVPGEPGETHVISGSLMGVSLGEWTNCVKMTGNLFTGDNIACSSGEVTK